MGGGRRRACGGRTGRGPGARTARPAGAKRRKPPGRRRVPPARTGSRESPGPRRSEEHTSELQSLMRISYAVFCLKKKNNEYNKKHEAGRQQKTIYTTTI